MPGLPLEQVRGAEPDMPRLPDNGKLQYWPHAVDIAASTLS
ncbi:hypothetical protein [Nonomuraea sp. NPDC046570]